MEIGKGSEKDVKSLKYTFTSLGATVELQEDLTYDQATKKINRLQVIDWNLFDYLFIGLMSHEDSGKFLTADCREKHMKISVQNFLA